MEFICNGSRGSKWYFDGENYVRVFCNRNGEKKKTYSPAEIENLPNKDIEEVNILKRHIKTL
jgi:hypothetical protein